MYDVLGDHAGALDLEVAADAGAVLLLGDAVAVGARRRQRLALDLRGRGRGRGSGRSGRSPGTRSSASAGRSGRPGAATGCTCGSLTFASRDFGSGVAAGHDHDPVVVARRVRPRPGSTSNPHLRLSARLILTRRAACLRVSLRSGWLGRSRKPSLRATSIERFASRQRVALADDAHVARALAGDGRGERAGLRHLAAGRRRHRGVRPRIGPVRRALEMRPSRRGHRDRERGAQGHAGQGENHRSHPSNRTACTGKRTGGGRRARRFASGRGAVADPVPRPGTERGGAVAGVRELAAAE